MSTENHFRHPSAMVTGDKSSPPTSFYTLRKKMSAHWFCVDGNMPQIKPYNVQKGKGRS